MDIARWSSLPLGRISYNGVTPDTNISVKSSENSVESTNFTLITYPYNEKVVSNV